MARTPRTTTQDPEIRLLSALADPTRMAIVRELAASTETCACDFTSTCDVGQPTVSHHLKVLREAGVVTSERRGQWIYYRLAPDVAERLALIARPDGVEVAAPAVAQQHGPLGLGCRATDRQRSGLSASGGISQRRVPPPGRSGRSTSIRASAPLRIGARSVSHSSASSSLKSGS